MYISVIGLLKTSFSHISRMQVDPFNLFKHLSRLTSMLLQIHAASPASLAPLCDEDPACKSLSAPSVTGSHSTSSTVCWQATTRRDEPLDQKVLTLCCETQPLFLQSYFAVFVFFFPRNLSLWLLDLLGESFVVLN